VCVVGILRCVSVCMKVCVCCVVTEVCVCVSLGHEKCV